MFTKYFVQINISFFIIELIFQNQFHLSQIAGSGKEGQR